MPQSLSRDLEHLAVASGDSTEDGRGPRPVRDTPCELALIVNCDRLWLVAGIIDDFAFPRFQNKKLQIAIADRDERFTIPVTLRHYGGAIRHLSNLGLIEDWKGN